MFNFFSELKNRYGDIINKINNYQMVMVGGNFLYIEGHLGLMTLSNDVIVFKVQNGIITVTGDKLKIKDITDKTLSIVGNIRSVERVWKTLLFLELGT